MNIGVLVYKYSFCLIGFYSYNVYKVVIVVYVFIFFIIVVLVNYFICFIEVGFRGVYLVVLGV